MHTHAHTHLYEAYVQKYTIVCDYLESVVGINTIFYHNPTL